MHAKNKGPAASRVGPPRRRAALIVPTAVLAATAGLIAWASWPVLRPAESVAVVQAVFDREAMPIAEASERSATRNAPTVQAPGWLEAEPYYVAASALSDGIVESVDVLEGDTVKRGQVVARLNANEAELWLRQAEAALLVAQAAARVAEAEHAAAETMWAEPIELDRAVEAGAAALAEAQAELAQLPALIASARADHVRLEHEAERSRRLAQRNAANDLERVINEQRAVAQEAQVAALVAREPMLASRVERLQAELRAAKRRLDLRIDDRRRLDAAAAALASARAEVEHAVATRDEATLELDEMAVRSPIDGVVQRRLKVPGDKAIVGMDSSHSAHIVHLYDPARLQVRVDVPLADASHLYVGQPCEVVVEVLPDRVFKGEVIIITHEADLQKNTLQAKVRVIDPDPILRPEMLTRVKFLPTGDGDDSSSTPVSANPMSRVLVPADAVDHTLGSPRVWLVTDRRNGRGTLSPRVVEVIDETDGWLAVAGHIEPGALIAVDLDQPREGRLVAYRAAHEGAAS